MEFKVQKEVLDSGVKDSLCCCGGHGFLRRFCGY